MWVKQFVIQIIEHFSSYSADWVGNDTSRTQAKQHINKFYKVINLSSENCIMNHMHSMYKNISNQKGKY